MRDLRTWLAEVEAAGELLRVSEEFDWDEEMSALTYMVSRAARERAPALLFENVRGHGPGRRALFNVMGPSPNRVALSLGLPPGRPVREYVALAREKLKLRLPPVTVAPDDAPVCENVLTGEQVDLGLFPAPKMWPRDGGRYAGTSDVVITRDPETGRLNLGSYRLMVLGRNRLGFYVSPGKDAKLHREAWWRRGEPCQVAACLGADPLLLAVAGWAFPKNVSEYEYAGGMAGEPVELVPGIATDLLVPARAEVVVEGICRPDQTLPEGPFGEFTGYYGRPQKETPVIEVQAVRFRGDPILTCGLMADYPACEHALLVAVIKSALIWDDLDKIGVPGIRGIYCHPAAAAGYAMIVVSLEQRYAGHAPQVLALAAQSSAGAYYTKWVVAVDEDVDPTDMDQVLWAMSTRCNPVEDIDFLRNTWSTWLDPTQVPLERRPYGSKALINACRDHRYLDRFAPRTLLRRETYRRLSERWARLGLPGRPPEILAFEEHADEPVIET
jgi:UbiD family decarboxylase